MGQVALDLGRGHRGDDRHLIARIKEVLGGHPTVSAVVTEAGKHHDRVHILELGDLPCTGVTRTAHQLGEADPHIRERNLHCAYVVHIENRLHTITPSAVSTSLIR